LGGPWPTLVGQQQYRQKRSGAKGEIIVMTTTTTNANGSIDGDVKTEQKNGNIEITVIHGTVAARISMATYHTPKRTSTVHARTHEPW
jgi:hypothetical protein